MNGEVSISIRNAYIIRIVAPLYIHHAKAVLQVA